MYLTRLEVEGLRGSDHRAVEGLDRLVPLPSGADGGALADAIDLLAAGLDPERLLPTAGRLGWATAATERVGDGPEPELLGLHPPAVDAVVAAENRALTVEAELALDPPLYGRLREHAARDPRMVTALGQRPSVVVKIGWLFTRDRTGVAPSLLMVRVGDVGFETSGKERPVWLPELMVDLGRRFARTDPFEAAAPVAERLLAASLSPVPAVRAGYARMVEALAHPPFDLPPPGLVRSEDRLELGFGPGLARVRQLGRPALDAVRLAEALFVRRPDVLVVDEPVSAEVRAWLGTVTDGVDAPVEQVLVR